MFKVISTYSEGDYNEFDIVRCSNCKREYIISSNQDFPACCHCEFEDIDIHEI